MLPPKAYDSHHRPAADDRSDRGIDGVTSDRCDPRTLHRRLGGRWVATKLAHTTIPFDVDPLGPANSLIFITGPMQTSTMSFTGRMNCTGVSPLTDGVASSNAGGVMSRTFAATGCGAVQIVGGTDQLAVVHVTDDECLLTTVPQLARCDGPRDMCVHRGDPCAWVRVRRMHRSGGQGLRAIRLDHDLRITGLRVGGGASVR
jgi:Aldehyde:ferredoxin oxidoreductase